MSSLNRLILLLSRSRKLFRLVSRVVFRVIEGSCEENSARLVLKMSNILSNFSMVSFK